MPSLPSSRRFVILSGSRSGTSLLSETLNVHPDILCHGELFHPTPGGHIKRAATDRSIDDAVALRAVDPWGFLDWALDQPGVPVAGFKMWRSQNETICDRLLADPTVLKIIYERENVLARYSSSRLVQATGVYNLHPDGKRPGKLDVLIPFEKRRFLAYLRDHQALFDLYRSKVKGPVLDLSYRRVVVEGFGPVLRFLGVPEQALPAQKQRLHGNRILDRFETSDRSEIAGTLEELGYPDWIEE